LQLATPVVAVGDRVQLVAEKVPVEFEVRFTLPVGVIALPRVETSVTVAVQLEAWFTTTEDGEQVMLVVVAWRLTLTIVDAVAVWPPESFAVRVTV
jgi:hypothetical protein